MRPLRGVVKNQLVQGEQDETAMARYLLGRLTGRNLARFEAQLAADDGLLARVSEVEQELIRDFLRGQLSWWDRRKFRQRLKSSLDLQEKTDAAGLLIAALSGKAEAAGRLAERGRERMQFPPFGGFSRLAAVAGAVVLCALAWLTVDDLRVRREVAGLRSRPSPTSAASEPLFSFLLSPVLVKGDAQTPRRIRLVGNAGRVRLRLEVPRLVDFREFRAVLRVIDGGFEVWSGAVGVAGMTPARGFAEADVPVASLPVGDYILYLSGLTPGGKWEDVESYSFGVTR